MTRRTTVKLIVAYIAYIFLGYVALVAAFYITAETIRTSRAAERTAEWILEFYMMGIAFLLPITFPAFFSFFISKLRVRYNAPRICRDILRSPLRHIIWDEIK